MFYLTKSEREAFNSILKAIRVFLKYPLQYSLGILLFYVSLVLIIGVFG